MEVAVLDVDIIIIDFIKLEGDHSAVREYPLAHKGQSQMYQPDAVIKEGNRTLDVADILYVTILQKVGDDKVCEHWSANH